MTWFMGESFIDRWFNAIDSSSASTLEMGNSVLVGDRGEGMKNCNWGRMVLEGLRLNNRGVEFLS